jgi:hypothetical protein
MPNIKSRFAPGFALCLAVAVLFVQSSTANAEVNAATLVLAKAAITNFKVIDLITGATVAAVTEDNTQLASVRDKEKKYIIDGLKRAGPGIISRIAKTEAAKYDLKQLSDIVELSELRHMQKIVLATANQKPLPQDSEITPSENAVLTRIGDHDYIISFIKEIIELASKDKEYTTAVTSAVTKAMK